MGSVEKAEWEKLNIKSGLFVYGSFSPPITDFFSLSNWAKRGWNLSYCPDVKNIGVNQVVFKLKYEDKVARALKNRFCRVRGSLLSLDLWKQIRYESTPSTTQAGAPSGQLVGSHGREMQGMEKPQSPVAKESPVKVNRKTPFQRNFRALKFQKKVTPKVSKRWIPVGRFPEYLQGLCIFFRNPLKLS
ncbi:hypothetical protein AMTRI_Chr10g231190 [Amborella trichopoda]